MLLVISAVMSVISLATAPSVRNAARDYLVTKDEDSFNDSLALWGITGLITAALSIALVVLSIIWLYRVSSNHRDARTGADLGAGMGDRRLVPAAAAVRHPAAGAARGVEGRQPGRAVRVADVEVRGRREPVDLDLVRRLQHRPAGDRRAGARRSPWATTPTRRRALRRSLRPGRSPNRRFAIAAAAAWFLVVRRFLARHAQLAAALRTVKLYIRPAREGRSRAELERRRRPRRQVSKDGRRQADTIAARLGARRRQPAGLVPAPAASSRSSRWRPSSGWACWSERLAEGASFERWLPPRGRGDRRHRHVQPRDVVPDLIMGPVRQGMELTTPRRLAQGDDLGVEGPGGEELLTPAAVEPPPPKRP